MEDLRLLPIHVDGVYVEIANPVPLPADPDAWIERAVSGHRVLTIAREQTERGWMFTLVETVNERDDRRVWFAFYDLFDRGVVLIASLEQAERADSLRSALRSADIDRTPRVVSLAQIWEST